MISDVKVKVDQLAPSVLSEGDMDYPAMSNVGQIFTVDWVNRLILAGCVYRMSWGTISGGTAHATVGTGTVVNLDMPFGIVAVDTGFLIPVSLQAGLIANADAENHYVTALLTADRAGTVESAAYIATLAGTAETPDNALDGGPAFQGRAVSDGTTALGANPTHSDILFYREWEMTGADALGPTDFVVDKEFKEPTFLAGPCALLLYFGGTEAVVGMGSLVFAHVPSNWVPIA